MTKSSFHDPCSNELPPSFPRAVDRVPMGTHQRRQPRFSEPGNLEHPFESGQDTKGSFIPYGKAKDESKEFQFYKKPSVTPGLLKHGQAQEEEGRRKAVSMDSF